MAELYTHPNGHVVTAYIATPYWLL